MNNSYLLQPPLSARASQSKRPPPHAIQMYTKYLVKRFRNKREEENLRECNQLISQLQHSLPSNNGSVTSRAGSNNRR